MKITEGDYRKYIAEKDYQLEDWPDEGESPDQFLVCENTDDENSKGWPWVTAKFYHQAFEDHQNLIEICANSLNTYQKCGLLPSELHLQMLIEQRRSEEISVLTTQLQQQNQELRDALKEIMYLRNYSADDEAQVYEFMVQSKAKQALTKEK